MVLQNGNENCVLQIELNKLGTNEELRKKYFQSENQIMEPNSASKTITN